MVIPWTVLSGALLLIGSLINGPVLTVVLASGSALGVLVFFGWNSCYRQGRSGQSLGRQVAGSRLVRIENGAPIGFRRALLRQICHAVEFGIGYLWPLWDEQRQTFADKIAGTIVVRVQD